MSTRSKLGERSPRADWDSLFFSLALATLIFDTLLAASWVVYKVVQ